MYTFCKGIYHKKLTHSSYVKSNLEPDEFLKILILIKIDDFRPFYRKIKKINDPRNFSKKYFILLFFFKKSYILKILR